jgi:hypothetical protein
MKITKKYLQKLIKEETARLVSKYGGPVDDYKPSLGTNPKYLASDRTSAVMRAMKDIMKQERLVREDFGAYPEIVVGPGELKPSEWETIYRDFAKRINKDMSADKATTILASIIRRVYAKGQCRSSRDPGCDRDLHRGFGSAYLIKLKPVRLATAGLAVVQTTIEESVLALEHRQGDTGMKITKKYLQKVIKEEMASHLKLGNTDHAQVNPKLLKAYLIQMMKLVQDLDEKVYAHAGRGGGEFATDEVRDIDAAIRSLAETHGIPIGDVLGQ